MDINMDYYKDSPDLCSLVHDMLYYTPHDRPNIVEIISKVAKLDCSILKHTSRVSTGSSKSRESSFVESPSTANPISALLRKFLLMQFAPPKFAHQSRSYTAINLAFDNNVVVVFNTERVILCRVQR